MGGDLAGQVRELLHALESAQHDLQSLFEIKRSALLRGHAGRLNELARSEEEIVNRLHALLGRRTEILTRAGRSDAAEDALHALVESECPEAGADLLPQFARVRRRADELRRESWVHWIVARQSHQHYGELLELFANRGEKPATYEETRPQAAAGGAILDASA